LLNEYESIKAFTDGSSIKNPGRVSNKNSLFDHPYILTNLIGW